MTRRETTSEFEGKREKKTRVYSRSLLTNFREDEREDNGKGST